MKKNKFKIIMTSPSIDPSENIGGISTLTKLITDKCKNINFLIFILGKKDCVKRNIKWILYQFIIPFRFALILKKYKPDLVHLNSPFEPLALVREYFISLVVLFLSKKYILHIRGGRYLSQSCDNFIFNAIIDRLLIGSSNIIVLGVNEKDKLLGRYKYIEDNKIIVLPNAVEVLDQDHILDKEYGGILRLLYLGRLDKNKGLPEIVAAIEGLFALGIDFELTVCGEGPYKDEFLSSLTPSIKDRVKFQGVVSGKLKNDILFQSHVFLLPSYFEGLPNALLESMGNGCVPVVTPVGSMPEVVDGMSNGFIVPLHDKESIINAIVSLHDDRKLLKEMGYQARKTIHEKFNIDNYLKKLNDIYVKSI